MGKTGKTKQSGDLAEDLMDELLEDSTQANSYVDAEAPIELSVADYFMEPIKESKSPYSTDVRDDLSTTRPLDDSYLESTKKFDQEDEGTIPSGDELGAFQKSSADSVGLKSPERAAVGRAEPLRSSGMVGPTDMALAQNENLRLAQDRILELEKEIERLRIENEELGAAGETLRRRSDELMSLNEESERKLEHEISTSSQEKEILRNSRDLLRKEAEELRQKNSELELRISTNIQRVRVRERELENRLELMKVETKALVRSKDEMILDLKRQIDQLNLELNNYRVKSQDLNKQISERQDTLRRTVKALRLALSMMEGDDENLMKKAK
ncbi:hypothetical protein GW916_05860 [bacterium]|nr:hypothetical protein [bacterium]